MAPTAIPWELPGGCDVVSPAFLHGICSLDVSSIVRISMEIMRKSGSGICSAWVEFGICLSEVVETFLAVFFLRLAGSLVVGDCAAAVCFRSIPTHTTWAQS